MSDAEITDVKIDRCSDNETKVTYVVSDSQLNSEIAFTVHSEYIDEIFNGGIGIETAVLYLIPLASIYGVNLISNKFAIDPVLKSNLKLYFKRIKMLPREVSGFPHRPIECDGNPMMWENYDEWLIKRKNIINPVEIVSPDSDIEPPGYKTRVGAFFSGGVDSTYTFLGVDEITDVIIIDGFNYANVSRIHRYLSKIKDAHPNVRTHVVTLPDLTYQMDSDLWQSFAHGPVLAAVGNLFQNYLTSVYISGTDRAPGIDMGTGYDIDYLFSSSKLRFLSYGAVNRYDKLKRICEHPMSNVILSEILICSDPSMREDMKNCSRCWKCIYTMRLLDSLGESWRATTFDWSNPEVSIVANDYSMMANMGNLISGYKRKNNKAGLEWCEIYINASANPNEPDSPTIKRLKEMILE